MKPSVLLVDDDPDVRNVIGALLADDGTFEVVGGAPDGAIGIALAAALQPDLVLLDLAMPVLDGLTVLPGILRAAPHAQVIVLSAFGTDRMVHAALAAGAVAFVQKGADLAGDLAAVLQDVVARPSATADRSLGE